MCCRISRRTASFPSALDTEVQSRKQSLSWSSVVQITRPYPILCQPHGLCYLNTTSFQYIRKCQSCVWLPDRENEILSIFDMTVNNRIFICILFTWKIRQVSTIRTITFPNVKLEWMNSNILKTILRLKAQLTWMTVFLTVKVIS